MNKLSDYIDGKHYTEKGIKLIKKQLGYENMPTWIVWGYMGEQGIDSHQVLVNAIKAGNEEVDE